MDIQQMMAPKPLQKNAQGVEKKSADLEQPEEKTTSGAVPKPAFLQLLQGLQADVTGLEAVVPEVSPLQGLDGLAVSELPASLIPDVEGEADALAQVAQADIQSLMGQAQHTDFSARGLSPEAEQRLEMQTMGLAERLASRGAQPHTAIGQTIATVAAGVQSVGDTAAMVMSASPAVIAQAAASVETLVQDVAERLDAEGASEGRMVLQGAWKLDDQQTQMNPALQRVVGQIEQWAAAVAGAQPKPQEVREQGSGAAADQASLLAQGAGSGTRLMENAVREAVQAEHAGSKDDSADTPVEDMRFWLQGKQQRAEVLLDRDGVAVRVQVSVSGNEAQVRFLSDQEQTREWIDNSVAQLRDMLSSQGMQLASVFVQSEERGQGQSSSDSNDNRESALAQAKRASIAVPQAVSGMAGQGRSGLDVYA